MFFYHAKKRDSSEQARNRGSASAWSSERNQESGTPATRSPRHRHHDENGSAGIEEPSSRRRIDPKRFAPWELRAKIATASFAFRGYDVANLGRSPELLAHSVYGPTVRRFLDEASAICEGTLGRKFDLAARVEAKEPTTLDNFAEDIATIVGMEMAHLALLREFFGVEIGKTRQNFGYSIGEMSALVAGGVFTMEEILPVPLACAADCAALAVGTTMGILFSRGPELVLEQVEELCQEVSAEGKGMVGASSYLSPNTVLLIGQGDSLDRLEKAIPSRYPEKVMLRRKAYKIPPLHTPLVWQKNISNRAAVDLYKIAGPRRAPRPKVVSCVTGTACYNDHNARETLIHWVDHPQRLWDVVCETLASDVELVVHVGPAPNLIPATFERLGNNVEKQLGNRYMKRLGWEVGSQLNRHAWLGRLLPSKAALLRAVHVEHIILEDWLLEQKMA